MGVQHRASLPVPCQRELACGKAQLYQILVYSATHATSKSHKIYLPSRLRDRRPDYLHFRKHRQPALPLAPHYPKSKSTAGGGHHNYSSFIIHYSLNKKSAPFQTTDLDIKFQCKIKLCRPPVTQLSPISNNRNGEFEAAHCRPQVTQLSPIGNNKNGEFTVAFSHTANLKRVTPARRNLKRHIAAVSGDPPQPPQPRCALLKMLSVGYTRLCKRHSR